MNKLSALISILPGEGRLVGLMLAHSFGIGIARVFTRTAAYTLFLVEFDAQSLPYVYIGISVVVALLSFLYLKLSARLSLPRLLVASVGFLLLVLVGFRLGLALTATRWLVFALPIGYEVLWTLTHLEFWNLAGCVFNVRQGKRLFGLIGTGEQVAIIASGFLTPVLVRWIATPNLLLAGMGAMVGVTGLLLYMCRSYAAPLAAPNDRREVSATPTSLAPLLRSRYVLLIFGLFALAMVAYFTTDNIFYAQVELRYPSEGQLASVIGVFLGAVGLLSLLSRALLTSPLMNRYGVRLGLLFTPLLLVPTGTLAAIAGLTLPAAFLWLVVALRLFNMVFFESIDVAALNVIYQPLPAAQRVQTQALVEGVVYATATGLAGLALWVSTTILGLGSVRLLGVLLVILLAWIVLGVLLGREYPRKLMQSLARRTLSGDGLSIVDGYTAAVLQQELQSPHPGVVIYALNTLEAAKPESLGTALPSLLDHPAPEVRRDVLQRIERLALTPAAAAVRQRLTTELQSDVRGAALRTLAALSDAGVSEELSTFLEDPDPQVRKGAIVGMLRSGGIGGVLAAGQKLLQMAAAAEPAERILAAQVLGEVAVESFYQPLVPLLQDEDLHVQRAALLAAGQLKNARLWPLVLEKLGAGPLRSVAAAALVAGGEAALPALSDAATSAGQSPEVLIQLARVCGRISGARAITWLKGRLAHPDAAVRTQVLRSLIRCGYQANREEVTLVGERIKAEAAYGAETLTVLADIGADKALQPLRCALDEALAQDRERLVLLLAFLYDRRSILRVRDNLTLPAAQKRAYALELIDVLVAPELKRVILPLLAGLPAEQELQQLHAFFPQPRRGRLQRLHELIASPEGHRDSWVRACALYAAGRMAASDLGEAAAAALSTAAPLVREMALWALARIDRARYSEHGGALRDDPSPQVARAARQWQSASRQEETMLSTVERVLVLKRVSIFVATPDDTLAEVATLLEEVPLAAGQTIFEKGDPGDSLYIIGEGEVRVHDGGRTLNHLRAGDVFGEMAVLEPEPRVASVTAVVDTQLLRLGQEPFYELLDEHSEVGRGIIRVLCRHLRARVQDLNELRARQAALEGSHGDATCLRADGPPPGPGQG